MNALTATRLWWAQSQLLRGILVLPLFLVAAYATAWSVYWFGLGVIVFLATAALVGFVYRIPIYYLGLAVSLRPLIDTLWFIRVDLAGMAMNVQRLTGLLLPLFFMGVLVLHVILGREERGRRLPLGVLWGILGFWLLAFTSMMRTLENPRSMMMDFFRSYANLVFVYVGYVFCRRKDFLDTFYKAFFLAMMIPVAVAVAQGLGMMPQTIFEEVKTNTTATFLQRIDADQQRLSGLYYDPGSLVVVLLSGFVAAFYLMASDQPRWWRIVGVVGFCALVFAMRNSYLRQGWVAVIVLLGTWLVLRRRMVTLIVGAALGTLAVMTNLEYMSMVFAGVWEVFTETNRTKLGYLWSGRIGAWMDISAWFAGAPWSDRMMGGGYGFSVEGEFRNVSNPHNQWVKIVMYNGLLGLAVYAVIMLSVLVVLLKNTSRSRTGDRWAVGMQAVMTHFVIYHFMSIGSQPMEQFNLAAPLFLTMGFVCYRQFDIHEGRLIEAEQRRDAATTGTAHALDGAPSAPSGRAIGAPLAAPPAPEGAT